MRWYLYIPSILVLLALGVELGALHGDSVVKVPSNLACVLDDDDAELKPCVLRETSFTECDPFIFAGLNLMAQGHKTDLVLSLEGAAIIPVCSGVRRHRWLCRECC
jgi:hypothetical protein